MLLSANKPCSACLQYGVTQFGLLERALTEVAEESSGCASNVATRCPYVLLLQGLFLRFCESQCKESKACFQVVAKMADWGRW